MSRYNIHGKEVDMSSCSIHDKNVNTSRSNIMTKMLI